MDPKEIERRRKISIKMKGKKPANFHDMQIKGWKSNLGKKGQLSPNYGRKASIETRKKQSLAKIGKPSWNKGGTAPWALNNLFSSGKIPWNKNKKFEQISGTKHWNWKGGISFEKGYATYIENVRRSRKKNNGGFHSFKEWEILKKKWNYMCLCCKKHEPEIILTEDHILPLSKGGRNDIANIQPLCMSCNRNKNARHINYIQLLPCLN